MNEQLDISSVKAFLAKNNSQITSDKIMNAQSFLEQYKYHLQSLIDCGSFGIVMKAQDERNDRVVAIKLMVVQSFELLQQALQEFQKTLLFDHPNIIKNFSQLYDNENETFFIISEFCPNGNLYDYSNSKELSEEEIKNIVDGIFKAIVEMHDKKMIHGDLKPKNILISSDFNIKVCDLGISKILQKQKTHTSPNGGTLCYMAPEQLKGQVRFESDMFAIGSIICFLCGLKIEDDMLLMLNLKNGILPSIIGHKHQDLLEIAFEMMKIEPSQRYSLSEKLSCILI